MIVEAFLNDLRKLSIFGVALFFIGFILSTAFLIFVGISTSVTGLSLFQVVKNKWEEEKKNLKD